VYVHQGEVYVVDDYDVEDGVAAVHLEDPEHTTQARSTTEISIVETQRTDVWGDAAISFGSVDVVRQVTSFVKRTATGAPLDEVPLDLPERTLRTKAVWWTLKGTAVMDALATADVPGAAHAAEHAAIGLLPLLATCDRWDIGGVSTDLHPDTGALTVFVYDGFPGGAGFAERGHDVAQRWLRVTRDAIEACECVDGCPSCVHSPKCGNGNEPLDKSGAVKLLDALLAQAPPIRDEDRMNSRYATPAVDRP
jgi:DEAD/DEAH box helicase domain-containing protein